MVDGLRMYSPTIEDIVRPYLGYPQLIQKAIILVETNPRFIGLTRSMKSVLKTLLTRASQVNGTTQIRARLDTVAMQSNVSTKTVERTMKTLREAGWIKTVTEGRSEWGVFESKRYQFTEILCEIVELPIGKTKPKQEQETEMSDGAVYVDLTFKRNYQEILLEKRKENPEADPVTLPEELKPIAELGVSPKGVCKLRGLATSKGYKLHDIFVVAKQYIEKNKMSKNGVYRYLETLIGKTSDYAARALQLIRMGGGKPDGVHQPANRAAKYAFKKFTAGKGVIIRIHDGTAEVTQDGQWIQTIAGKVMEEIYNKIESGRLKEIVE